MEIDYNSIKNKETRLQVLKKLLMSAHLRAIVCPIDKATTLLAITGWSIRVISLSVGISNSRFQRALRAQIEGRTIGTTGRPKYLSTEEEGELVKLIKNKSLQRECMTRSEIREEVCLKRVLLKYNQNNTNKHT